VKGTEHRWNDRGSGWVLGSFCLSRLPPCRLVPRLSFIPAGGLGEGRSLTFPSLRIASVGSSFRPPSFTHTLHSSHEVTEGNGVGGNVGRRTSDRPTRRMEDGRKEPENQALTIPLSSYLQVLISILLSHITGTN
jgi:hypothetical protein